MLRGAAAIALGPALEHESLRDPEDSDDDWELDSPDQWGEPYLMLIDGGDVILEG